VRKEQVQRKGLNANKTQRRKDKNVKNLEQNKTSKIRNKEERLGISSIKKKELSGNK
jgi:hypothetical protein